MTTSRTFISLCLLFALTLTACDDATGPEPGGDDDDISVPSAYSFESRFAEGESAVAYPGQVTRNLLIQDLKILIDGLAEEGAEPVTEAELLSRYEYDDADLAIVTGTDPNPAAKRYNQIATGKSLSGKITKEYSDGNLAGRDVTADELIRGYFEQIAANSQDDGKLGTPAAYTTDEGVDMSQLINKVLMGAVVYSQGTAKYLSDDILSNANNSEPRNEDASFSEMEHVWDEAFGYFGAARAYADFSDDDLAGGYTAYRDADGDGAIDFNNEYNFAFATYAGKRDLDGTGIDFTDDLFSAFLRGRTAIVNEKSLQTIYEHRDEARRTWEKLVAANVVHYLNSTMSDVEEVTAAQVDAKDNEEYNEHWSEAKGFAYALQYNPARAISDGDLRQLHDLLGDAPRYAEGGSDEAAAYRAQLQEAKDLLQQTYSFSDANMANW